MRYLLLIPAMLLFLSYIPFVHKMDMKEAMAKTEKSGCCKKAKAKTQKHCSSEKNNCAKQDATCICIFCFQYASPDQLGIKLHLGVDIKNYELADYIQQNWKDPLLMAPWQPPDVS